MPIRAVLFDFDGVLADTENVHVAAWERTFDAIGLDVAPDDCARAAEEDDRAFLADVFARRGIEGADLDGWLRRKQALTLGLLAGSAWLYPGVAALIDRLRGRARLAVVTTTWRENVESALKAHGLGEAFELIVAKDDVERPKPDPAGYRLALKRLKLRPAEAIALEDSPGGLEAARGAGLRAVAVGHRRPEGDWVGGGPFVPDLRRTEAVLEALGLD